MSSAPYDAAAGAAAAMTKGSFERAAVSMYGVNSGSLNESK